MLYNTRARDIIRSDLNRGYRLTKREDDILATIRPDPLGSFFLPFSLLHTASAFALPQSFLNQFFSHPGPPRWDFRFYRDFLNF